MSLQASGQLEAVGHRVLAVLIVGDNVVQQDVTQVGQGHDLSSGDAQHDGNVQEGLWVGGGGVS